MLRLRSLLDPGPVPHGDNRHQWVNGPITEAELQELRECLRRNRHFMTRSPESHSMTGSDRSAVMAVGNRAT